MVRQVGGTSYYTQEKAKGRACAPQRPLLGRRGQPNSWLLEEHPSARRPRPVRSRGLCFPSGLGQPALSRRLTGQIARCLLHRGPCQRRLRCPYLMGEAVGLRRHGRAEGTLIFPLPRLDFPVHPPSARLRTRRRQAGRLGKQVDGQNWGTALARIGAEPSALDQYKFIHHLPSAPPA